MTSVLLLSGLLAGVISTLAGQGGGLMALLLLSLVVGPRDALVLTAPGLALANIHRAWLFRHAVSMPIVKRLAVTMLPASLLMGTMMLAVPTVILRVLLVFATTVALGRKLLKVHIPRAAWMPAGAVIGAFGATSGGAGVLLTPVLVSAGLRGEALVGSTAATALALNSGRLIGYTLGGSFTTRLLGASAVMTVALIAGNLLGHRTRKLLTEHSLHRIELGTMVLATLACVAGAR